MTHANGSGEAPSRIEGSAAERLRFAWLVASACLLLTVPRLLLHELWRDEAWLWIVVTESRSLSDLFLPLRRSGQGYLFPLLCFFLRQVSTSPRAMQALHGVLAAVGAFVFARWAPLPRRERAVVVLGYFPFFEYAVISRHYVLGALFAWLACVAVRGRRPALALGAALGLLCQTTVYGYILAAALACGAWLDRRLRRSELAPLPWTEVAAGFALALAGAVAGLLQLIPLPGTSFAPGWHFAWDATHAGLVLSTPWRAFVPLPRPGLHFWNTNLVDTAPLALQAGAGLATLALAVAILWRRKVALAIFAVGGAGLLVFTYVKYLGTLRHHGHWWLLFLAALWMGGADLLGDRRSWRSRALLVFLLLHCGVAAYASWMDLRHPFSNGAATAELLRSAGLDRYPLLGHREPPAATVALVLGRPLFSPSRGSYTTHPDYGPEQREMSDPEVRCAARALARREGRDVVLVINRELPPWGELEAAGARTGAIVSTEDYHLYRLHRERLDGTREAARCAGEAQPSARSLRIPPVQDRQAARGEMRPNRPDPT